MNKIGVRLRCEVCNSQAVVTHPGEGEPTCCDRRMSPIDAEGGVAAEQSDTAGGG